MNQFLIYAAHFCVVYNIIFITYLLYKEIFGRQPVTFLELWLYFESKFEQMQKVIEEENKEMRNKMFHSFFNSEARTFENFKNELKRWKNENKNKT